MQSKHVAAIGISLLIAVSAAMWWKQRSPAPTPEYQSSKTVNVAQVEPERAAPKPASPSAQAPAPGIAADDAAPAPAPPPEPEVESEPEETPSEPWELVLSLESKDVFDVEAPIEKLIVLAYDEETGPIDRFEFSPETREPIALDHWPKFLAFAPIVGDVAAPNAYLALPDDPAEKGGIWRGNVPLEFATERERRNRQSTRHNHVAEEEGRRLSFGLIEMEALAEEAAEGVRRLELNVSLVVVPFGVLEARVTNLAAADGQGSLSPDGVEERIERVFLRPSRFGFGRGGFGRGGGSQSPEVRWRRMMVNSSLYRDSSNRQIPERQAAIEGDRVFFYGLPPGSYQVRIVTSDERQGLSESTLVEPGKDAVAEVFLQDAARLAVQVFAKEDDERWPLAGAEVQVLVPNVTRDTRSTTTEIEYTSGSAARGQVTNGRTTEKTDSTGKAVFTGLSEGKADIVVSHPEFGTAKQLARLIPYAPNEVEILLHKGRAVVNFELIGAEEYVPTNADITASRSDINRGRGRGNDDGQRIRFDSDEESAPPELTMELDYATWDFRFSGSLSHVETREAVRFSRSVRQFEISDPGPHTVAFHLPRPLPVEIHLTSGGRPATEVEFQIREGFSQDSSTQRAETDEKGIARVNLPPAAYSAYQRQRGGVRVLGELTVEPDRENIFTFEVEPQLSLVGNLLNAETGEGVSRASVGVQIESEDSPGEFETYRSFRRPTITEGNGSFEISSLAAGIYRLQFQRSGFEMLLTDPFTLDEESSLRPLTFEMKPGGGTGVIEGIVQAPDGLPLDQVFFTELLDEEGVDWRPRRVRVDDGFYEINRLKTGDYMATIYPNSWSERSLILLPHTSPPISVVDGERTVYDVIFESGGAIDILATDPDGAPLALVDLELIDSRGRAAVTFPVFGMTPEPRTGSGGTYLWSPLPADTYTIRATLAGYAMENPQAVIVSPNRTSRITIAMSPGN